MEFEYIETPAVATPTVAPVEAAPAEPQEKFITIKISTTISVPAATYLAEIEGNISFIHDKLVEIAEGLQGTKLSSEIE